MRRHRMLIAFACELAAVYVAQAICQCCAGRTGVNWGQPSGWFVRWTQGESDENLHRKLQ